MSANASVSSSDPRGAADEQYAAAYVLGLADDALVYAQRLAEWLTHAPELEEDMALANISLDLIGQARSLYTRSGELDGTGRGEDDFAYLRDELEFRNVHLVEQERGDFAREMARLLWFSTYQHWLYGTSTAASGDDTLRAVAGKAVKEVAYHVDHARQWVLRLGDGTEQSHRRMQAALVSVAPYVEELFDDDAVSTAAVGAGLGRLPSSGRDWVLARVGAVVEEATLTMPDPPAWRSRGGRDGIHSERMGFLLADLQHIARSHPGAAW